MQWHEIRKRGILWEKLEEAQAECVDAVSRDPESAFLLVSEPTPTFTAGLSAPLADLLWNEAELTRHEASVQRVSRGGKWTYHGPGQILVYPIVRLDRLGFERRAVFQFMKTLRGSLQTFAESAGLVTEVRDRPFGVFAKERKLTSFGMSVHRGIASHGLALYLKPQDRYFRGIHPCGVPGETSISLSELGWQSDWDDTATQIIEYVKKGFKTAEN